MSVTRTKLLKDRMTNHGENARNDEKSADEPSGKGGVDARELAEKLKHVRRHFWGKFRKVVGKLPFAEDLVAAYYCTLDPKTPPRVRMTLVSALAYFILPLDVVPDFILGLGYTDDAAVLALALRMVSNHISPAHRAAAKSALANLDGAPAPSADANTRTVIDVEPNNSGST